MQNEFITANRNELGRRCRHLLIVALAVLPIGTRAASQSPEAAVSPVTAVADASTEASYHAAVADARAGLSEQALVVLHSLVERFPLRQDILGDYVVVLGWAGEHGAAVALVDKVDRANAPAYVVESLANSALRLQRYEMAELLYREVLARFPQRVESQIGLARTLADGGKADEGAKIIEGLRARYPRRSDVLEAYADIATARRDYSGTPEANQAIVDGLRARYPRRTEVLINFAEVASDRRDYFGALSAYQAILKFEPDNATALQGKIHALAHLQAPSLAVELADRAPGALGAGERADLDADQTAQEIRWGTIAADNGRGQSRYAGLDLALLDSEAAGRRALDPDATLSPLERRLVLDRIIALRERHRMRDTIALYEAMAARPEPLPAYALAESASAYLTLEQPDTAVRLYREALLTDPDNLETKLGLFYALVESEQHREARTYIETVVASTPQWIDAWSPATIIENPAYTRVLAASAMTPLFANQPGKSEPRLHALSDRAPYQTGVRTDYASSMRARGWPRAAEEELRWVLAVDPDNAGALGERAGALLEMRDYRTAQTALGAAQEAIADNGRVVRAARLLAVHDMREFIIEGNFGRSSGGSPFGSSDNAIESWLYSQPLDYNYRVFAHVYHAGAEFDTGPGRRNRGGVGVEYSSTLIVAAAEVSQDKHGTGAAASIALKPSDFWTFQATLDSRANEMPLKGWVAGINAWRASLDATWQASESRSAAVTAAYMDFSDGNHRETAQARWTERVYAGPVYQLEITGALYASRNSLVGAPYFNPSGDFSPTVEFMNEWTQWRRYTRSFKHRLVLTAGTYRQDGFGTGPVYGGRYEQEWDADDRLALRYGIGRSLNPYDGVQTGRNYAYFFLTWRF